MKDESYKDKYIEDLLEIIKQQQIQITNLIELVNKRDYTQPQYHDIYPNTPIYPNYPIITCSDEVNK